jgi:hypothetical protein
MFARDCQRGTRSSFVSFANKPRAAASQNALVVKRLADGILPLAMELPLLDDEDSDNLTQQHPPDFYPRLSQTPVSD